MERYPTEYEKTGNNVPVSSDLLLEGVLRELQRYDHLVSATGNSPQFSPYTDPIIIDIDGGRQVQVPEQIQSQAIQIWTEQHAQPNMMNNDYGAAKREYEELSRQTQYAHSHPRAQQTHQMQEPNDDIQQKVIIVEKTDNRYLYLLILILVCGAAYYYYHNKN